MRRQETATAWRAPLASAGLDDPARLLDVAPDAAGLSGQLEPLTKPGLGGRERWRWRVTTDGLSRTLYIKRYPPGSLRTQWDRLLRQDRRRGRAGWEFAQAQRLIAASIPAATPVAYAEEVGSAVERRGVVILEEAPGEACDRAWRKLIAANDPWTRGWARQEITQRLARLVAAFHTAAWCHRDLYLCHIFVDLSGGRQAPPRFCLIDLARTFSPRLRRMRWVLKDLSQLDYSAIELGLSRTDRIRFLRAYLGLESGAPRMRWYIARVLARSRRIHARAARKARRP